MTNWSSYAMKLIKCILLLAVTVLIAGTLGYSPEDLKSFFAICNMSMMFTSTRAVSSSTSDSTN